MEVLNLEWGAVWDRGVPVPLLELEPSLPPPGWGPLELPSYQD